MKTKITLASLIILEVLVASLIYVRFNEVAYNGDALYEAQVARNIIDGKGYSTNEMPLYAVDLYKEKGLSLEAPWVNTHKFVLPVYLKLAFIKVFGDSLSSVTFLYSYFFHFLTVILIYFFALKLWPKNIAFAFLSAFIFLVNPILGFGTPYIMLSGLNLGIDAFLFLLLLYAAHSWWKERKDWLLFVSGLLSGVAFLDRYNSGLYIVIAFLGLAYLFVWRRDPDTSLRQAVKIFCKKYLVYISGFAIVAALFIAWNLRATGSAFLSINGLFQLLFDTRYNSFIDPWYKLEYIFETDNPLKFALAHPVPMFIKWFKYAALDIVRFFSFENVLWWTPLVLAYFALRRRFVEVSRSIDFILLIVLGLVCLQAIILPIWAGSVAYFFYLFPPFSFAIAYVLYSLYAWKGELWPSATPIRGIFDKTLDSSGGSLLRGGILVLLAATALLLIVHSSFTLLFQPLSIKGYLVTIFTLCVVIGTIVVIVRFKRYLLMPLYIVLGLAYFISQAGLLTAPTQAEILRGRWDLEDNPNNIDILESLDKNGVSLSVTPWNSVWWSDNKLEALPLPEYPDQIYLLEQEYGQQIDSLYLNKISLYPFKYIPHPWSAYERAIRHGYGFEGFDVAKRTSDGIILARGRKNDSAANVIDFGKQSANSHLIWGWGENEREGNVDYASAGPYMYLGQTKSIFQGTREDEKKVSKEQIVTAPDIVVGASEGSSKWYAEPHAEVTFLVQGDAPRQARISMRSVEGKRDVTILLNGNLLYRDQPGLSLGTFDIDESWKVISVGLDGHELNQGINKLSFVFYGTPSEKGYADFDYIEFLK